MKKRVFFVTGHYFESKRKAGLHWLAEAYWRAGWEVIFFTSAISWLSWLHRNHRMAYPIPREAHQLRWVREGLGSYVWFTPWHPINLRLWGLNHLAHGFFARYGRFPLGQAEALVRDADLFIFETIPGLELFERFRQLNPEARYVYRVSDDMRLLRHYHRVTIEAEERYAAHFDLISVPNAGLLKYFHHLPHAVEHPHGIRKELFDQEVSSPFDRTWSTHLIYVGTGHFDYDFLDQASTAFPAWAFHIIGPIPHLPRRANIFAYGEMAFEETIPFLKQADIGLHPLAYTPGAEVFADSLKVIQYTYCRLPIVAPEPLRSCRTNTFYYRPGDAASIRQALQAAQRFSCDAVETGAISSWDELAKACAGE